MIRIYPMPAPSIETPPAPDPDVGAVTLTKKDAEDGSPIQGAVFALQLQSGNGWEHTSHSGTTDGSGILQLSDLSAGTFRIVETAAAEGYDLASAIFTSETFTVVEGGGSQSFSVTATNQKTGAGDTQGMQPQQDGAAVNVDQLLEELKDQDAQALTEYATANNIDLGQATAQSGIYKKIADHLKAQATAGQ